MGSGGMQPLAMKELQSNERDQKGSGNPPLLGGLEVGAGLPMPLTSGSVWWS